MSFAIKLQAGMTCLGVFASLSLLAVGRVALAQAVPSENPAIEGNPAAVESSPSQILFSPLTPSCPLPPLPVSQSPFNEVTGLSTSGVTYRSASASYSPGDGSDGDWGMQIRQLLQEGRLEAALEIVPRIQDESKRSENLAAISNAYLERGQPQQAETIALSIPATVPTNDDPTDDERIGLVASPREQALSAIATFYINAGQLDSALATVDQLDEAARVSLWLDIAQKYRERGQPAATIPLLDRALESYQTSVKWAAGAPAEIVNLVEFLALARFAQEYSESGVSEKAVALADRVFALAQTLPLRVQSFRSFSTTLAMTAIYRNANQKEKADSVFTFVLQKIDALDDPLLKVRVFSLVSRLYAAVQETDRAQEILSQAQRYADQVSDPAQRNVSIVSLIQNYVEFGQYDNAFNFAEAIEPLALRQQVQQAIGCARSSSETSADSKSKGK